MSIARGELLKPAPATVQRYVYVRMIAPQVDAVEGKLQSGDVVTIPEDKALRWVYRARIAVPATRKEYLEYANRAGINRKGFVIPEKPVFEYVEPDFTEAPTATAVKGDGAKQVADAVEPTLADKLENLTAGENVAPEEPREERPPEAPRQQPGVFNQAIERGPMSDSRREDRRPEKNRNR
ncbi:MAG: hypothetical protein E6R03_01780 [Hyphomicrobiaceae bacterium]|nr:MAG: hypothetical protein E6R03_01780 [Hyphomicrobiaceae bacterium]